MEKRYLLESKFQVVLNLLALATVIQLELLYLTHNLKICKKKYVCLKCQCTSGGKHLFRKKPLGRRWHLMSSSARSGAANLVSVTSGTERERGFVGIGACRSAPLW